MPRRPTPTPSEFRRLETSANTVVLEGVRTIEAIQALAPDVLAAGCREVERGREVAPDEPYCLACNRCNVERLPEVHPCPECKCPEYRILPPLQVSGGRLPSEADLARAWTAADPPAEPGEEPPC